MKVSTSSYDTATLVEGLAAMPDLLESAVQGIDQALLDIAEEGEWSVQTMLAHLRDDEFMVMRPRLVRITLEDHPQLAPFDEKAWANTRWQGRDAPHESLADFRLQRQASMMLLHRLQQDGPRRIRALGIRFVSRPGLRNPPCER